MTTLDLRPLSLGELLDRTFTLYRGHFLLFVGISAIPRVFVLLIQLAQIVFAPARGVFTPPDPNVPGQMPSFSATGIAYAVVFFFAVLIASVLASMWSQGATVIAVSDLYLGRTTTLGEAFRRVWGELGTIFGVAVLSGLAVFGGCILLIIPGIYIALRLAVGVQAAVLENIGPGDALSRSFALTKENAGRVFLIFLLYGFLLYGAIALLGAPFLIGTVLTKSNPDLVRMFTMFTQVGSFIAESLAIPFVTIAMSLFYYDMRVRKEGFDLQMMMNPVAGVVPQASVVPRMLS
ncbi:MAG: hypothetical protein WBF06_01285 [Candidatus Acidiferrales bacterium]